MTVPTTDSSTVPTTAPTGDPADEPSVPESPAVGAFPAFSEDLRARTRARHSQAEGTDFMAALMDGRVPRAGLELLFAQLVRVYEALETVAEELRDDPVAGRFVAPELTRAPSLRADLGHLLGEPWRGQLPALPATQAYVQRIEATRSWPGGFVAHHYTRYLGDLSGGLAIGSRIARTFGLQVGADGLRFHHFAQIPKPAAFKTAYRETLDATEWGVEERDRVIEEVLVAYDLNSALLAALATEVPLVRSAAVLDDDAVEAILHHMNTDHVEDTLAIVRFHAGLPEAEHAWMSGLDEQEGRFVVVVDGAERALALPWPVPVTGRADIRRAVVALHESALLGND